MKLSEKKIQKILKDILNCFQALNKLNIIHCDLKPENILLDKNKNYKIVDFGSASFYGDFDYDFLQTKPYRAPEITFGCQFNQQADFFSLGCILYELLTSKLLFPYKF